LKEFYLEFISENSHITISTNDKKFCNKLSKLKKEYPSEVSLIENADGWFCANLPMDWFKFPRPKKIIKEEQRKAASERMKKYHDSKRGV